MRQTLRVANKKMKLIKLMPAKLYIDNNNNNLFDIMEIKKSVIDSGCV